jgi:uncharacterized membrane protein YcaP (DUF421 family)
MWFDTWGQLVRVLVAGVTAYASLVVVLRVSGKRTLSKLNAFDLVVTVALGSTLATIALSGDVAIVEGVAGLLVLVIAQYLVAQASVHVRLLRRAVRSEAVVLVTDGRLHEDVMRDQRVTAAEVHQAIRNSGIGGTELVAAVVLETDGTLSVIAADQRGTGSSLP